MPYSSGHDVHRDKQYCTRVPATAVRTSGDDAITLSIAKPILIRDAVPVAGTSERVTF